MFKSIIYSTLVAIFLMAFDTKPIDYSKRARKSPYIRAGSTQTGRLSKSHPKR
jgi:hypothetical protein